MYAGFGGVAFVIARDYSFGSAGRMGPGYFPSVLSCLLMGFGVLALLRGLRRDGEGFGGFAWRQAAIVLAATAAFGYLFRKLGCEPVQMMLGFIFGPMMEEFLHRALLLSKDDPTVIIRRPLSATMLVIAVLAMVTVLLPALRKSREEAFAEED